MNSIKECFDRAPYFSAKHENYFEIYDLLLTKYRGKNIIFIEFGVFAGGSLFMWREFFGPQARIIGVDLNPDALKWRDFGFEIFIGDQGSEKFLKNLFLQVGEVDIVLDDGGHKFHQQIITSTISLRFIKDGGALIVEDTHTSYLNEFGGPSNHSFMSWASNCVDAMHTRYSPLVKNYSLGPISSCVYSMEFFESIVVFNVNRKLCKVNLPCVNGGIYKEQVDFRYQGSVFGRLLAFRRSKRASSRFHARFFQIFEYIFKNFILSFLRILERLKMLRYRKYFKGIN